MPATADERILSLQLIPHPEGGYYREIYRSSETVSADALPNRYPAERCFSTSVYYLLRTGEFSAFHRLKSDEIWHYHDGAAMTLYIIRPNGVLEQIMVGGDDNFQCVIPLGCWFAACPGPGQGYSLVGCTVSPGFCFDDFELAEAERLTDIFPEHEGVIRRFCRGS